MILMYLGFAATGTVLSGQAINLMFGFSTPAAGIIIFGALTALVAIVGYKLIHGGPHLHRDRHPGLRLPGLAAVPPLRRGQRLRPEALHLDQFSDGHGPVGRLADDFAPYVADYSRYLPRKTSTAATFWTTFGGSVISAQLAMTFGVLVAPWRQLHQEPGRLPGRARGPAGRGDLSGHRDRQAHGELPQRLWRRHDHADHGQRLQRQKQFSPATRLVYILGFVLLTVLVALLASSNFLATFKNFVLLLLTVFVPWSAVNLVDYYLISKEKVDIPALYNSQGRYGAYNGVALFSYVLGIVVQIPFINQAMYEGPLAKAMGGADISWIVSLIVTSLVYYPLAKKTMKVPDQMIYPADQAGTSHSSGKAAYLNTASA